MKNIHLIPTDKPSRLFENISGKLVLTIEYYPNESTIQNRNIYITSDENGKHGEWVYWDKDKESPIKFQRGEYLNTKKIILTTDPDLIKDGVQSIDDEFLEWFVKNSSCEEVEVETEIKWKSTVYDQPDIENGYNYKIIIPKEEPKQETLEEAAERFLKDGARKFKTAKQVLIAFTEWQVERMYSEEEIESIWKFALYSAEQHDKFGTKNKSYFIRKDVEEFIEQFKKK